MAWPPLSFLFKGAGVLNSVIVAVFFAASTAVMLISNELFLSKLVESWASSEGHKVLRLRPLLISEIPAGWSHLRLEWEEEWVWAWVEIEDSAGAIRSARIVWDKALKSNPQVIWDQD